MCQYLPTAKLIEIEVIESNKEKFEKKIIFRC